MVPPPGRAAAIFEEALCSVSDSSISGEWNCVHLLGFIQKATDLIRTVLHFLLLFKLTCPCWETSSLSGGETCFWIVPWELWQGLQWGRPGFDSWVGKFPGAGNGNPHQCSCLENPTDRGAWWATVHGITRVGHDLALSFFFNEKCAFHAHGTKCAPPRSAQRDVDWVGSHSPWMS